MNPNFPCKCGHGLHLHTGFWSLIGIARPTGCVVTAGYGDGSLLCECLEFKADTLGYLEKKYEESLQ